MDARQVTTEEIQCPEIVFKLGEAFYTINSRHVNSIMLLPEHQALPDVPPYISGLMMFRGEAVPLLDLRTILGKIPLQVEYQQFVMMLEQRKQDHVRWAQELSRCIETGEQFTLATDPHQCAFGKWYDHYHSDNNAVNFHLKKIDDPHQKLHAAALEVEECKRIADLQKRTDAMHKVLGRVESEYVPAVVSLLDQTGHVLQDSYREMVVVIGMEGKQVGLIIDEVLSVEELEELCDHQEISRFHDTAYVTAVKRSPRYQGLILQIDENQLMELAASAVSERLQRAQ